MLQTGPRREPLGVLWMAAALVAAAFLGATLGLVWQSAGFSEPAVEEPAEPAS